MNISHGGIRGLAVAATTDVVGTSSGDHAIAVAVISGVFGLVVVLVTQLVSKWHSGRDADHLPEQLVELIKAQGEEIVELRKQLDRRKRPRT